MALPMQNYYQQNNQYQQNIMMIPVQGEASARMYPVAAGNTVFLVDFDAGMFWLKGTAPNGLPQTWRKFEFKEIIERPETIQSAPNAVTREEFDTVTRKLDQLLAALGEGNKNEQSA